MGFDRIKGKVTLRQGGRIWNPPLRWVFLLFVPNAVRWLPAAAPVRPAKYMEKPSAIPCRFYQSCANFIKILSFKTRRTPAGSVTDFVAQSPVLSNFGNNLQILPGIFVAFFVWKPLHFMEIYGILLVSKSNRRINGGK